MLRIELGCTARPPWHAAVLYDYPELCATAELYLPPLVFNCRFLLHLSLHLTICLHVSVLLWFVFICLDMRLCGIMLI